MNSKLFTEITRNYKLGMPKMFFGGISENWFLKEFGDLHWELIAKSYNTDVDKLVDSNGDRLYASFVRIKWESNRDLAAFKENDSFQIKSEIARFGNKMLFSEQELFGTGKKINASLMTVFSARSTNNTSLKKAVPISSIDEKTKTHEELPEFAKGFLSVKSDLLNANLESWSHELKGYAIKDSTDIIAEYTYEIEPYTDINGVGLLYFASYPTINDKCERMVFNKLFDIQDSDWANLGSCAARDLFYFGNANPSDKLIYKLNNYEFVGKNKIIISSSIYRDADNVLISKQVTVRNLIKDWKNHKSATIDLKKVKAQKESSLPSEKLQPTTELNKQDLIIQICDFLSKTIGNKSITGNTDLSLLGIESILFMELSEYLNLELGLATNPSKFYGLKNCNEIANSIFNLSDEKNGELPEKKNTEEIAIVATSFKIPGANSIPSFWKILQEGKSTISELPEGRWEWPDDIILTDSHKGINSGGFIDGIDEFDPSFFNISPVEAELMDPQQRLLLELSWELFERTSRKSEEYVGKNIGVFIGASGSDYDQLTYASNEGLSVTGTAQALLANRISYFFDLKGPSKSIDTACSSSLVALNDAIDSLQSGGCSEAIVGGVNLMCNNAKTIAYYNSKMLSVNGKCQTFDEKANGYVRGEGSILFLLKPKSKALEDGDNILGLIKSSSVNHGGRVSGITVPNPKQQTDLIVNALTKADLTVSDLTYIETHGTGTGLGDPIEINGLNEVARKMRGSDLNSRCGLGSVKTNIGHLEAASGLAGILKLLTAMQYKQIPATINFETLNPKIDFENGPFYVQHQLLNWDIKEGYNQRIAGVSNFGVGGTNAFVIIASTPDKLEVINTQSELNPQLFILSAKTEDALLKIATNLSTYLHSNVDCKLNIVAKTLQLGRTELTYRLAFVAENRLELLNQLDAFSSSSTNANYHLGKCTDEMEVETNQKRINDLLDGIMSTENLNSLAKEWVNGAKLDWNLLNKDTTEKYFDLPTYPFAKEKYWLPLNGNSKTKVKADINIQPDFNGSEFITSLNNKPLLNTQSNQLRGMVFPELIQEIAALTDGEKHFMLKNVFWTPPSDINKKTKKVQTKLVNVNNEVFFELSAENQPLFFGELIESNRNDSSSLDQFEKITSLAPFQKQEIDKINQLLQQNGKGNIIQLFQAGNTYYGEYFISSKDNLPQQDYSEVLVYLWTIYKQIKDRSGGISVRLPESFYPYFSSEVKLSGKLDSKFRFKIVDHENSCDLHFYNRNGIEQLSIKNLK